LKTEDHTLDHPGENENTYIDEQLKVHQQQLYLPKSVSLMNP